MKLEGYPMYKMHYCSKHSEHPPLFPCKIFDGIIVGYYCVSCDDFVPMHNPEIGVIKNLFSMHKKDGLQVKRKITCVQ